MMAKVTGTGGLRPKPRLERTDISKDGALTGTEAKKSEQFDANKGGPVAKKGLKAGREIDAAQAKERPGKRAAYDIDKDAKVSLPEYWTGKPGRTETKEIEKVEADIDGLVSKAKPSAGRKADWKAFIEKKAEDLFAKKDAGTGPRLP